MFLKLLCIYVHVTRRTYLVAHSCAGRVALEEENEAQTEFLPHPELDLLVGFQSTWKEEGRNRNGYCRRGLKEQGVCRAAQ